MSMLDLASAAQIGLPQLATPAAPGTLVESAVSAGRSRLSAVSEFPRVGLSMRFQVLVDHEYDLGRWTSCEGLKVDFEFESVRSGGDYGRTYVFPKVVTFGKVTLKRAVESGQYERVRQWLRDVAAQWLNGNGQPITGTTVTIIVLDVYQEQAALWQLQNAFPVSWSGPSLGTKTSDIASETLVLEHDGFLGEPA